MEVTYQKKFVKEVARLPAKVKKSVIEVMEQLKKAEKLETSGVDYKPMEGQKKGENYYRIRVGQWRIGVKHIHPDVVVMTVLTRGDVYKHFPPK